MLSDYFEFIKENASKFFVHWNMRDINYGFQALEHRGKVLGLNNVFNLPDSMKFDLARMLYQRYGANYISHPRLGNLIKFNNITDRNLLTGEEEAEAFKNNEFLKLHQSTLRKVDSFESILEHVEDRNLKVLSKFKDIYGLDFGSIILMIKKHWLFSLIVLLTGVLTFFMPKLTT